MTSMRCFVGDLNNSEHLKVIPLFLFITYAQPLHNRVEASQVHICTAGIEMLAKVHML